MRFIPPPAHSSGVGAPVIGDLDGEYRHDSRRNILEWCLPVIDVKNKTGSLEFSVAGQPGDFFPINVSFVSKANYCDIQVSPSDPGNRSADRRFCPSPEIAGSVSISNNVCL